MDGASGCFHGFQGLPTSNTATGATGSLNSADGSTCPNSNGGGGGGGTQQQQQQQQCTVREQDRFMPIANVIRIMRKVLPSHAKISDDAKETIQECVSEFISFITSEANDRCQREQRKTITAEDVLWAMSKLGFDNYIDPLTVFLHRYRDLEGDHRGSIRGEPLPFKRSASAANLQPAAAPLPLPLPKTGGVDAYGVIPAPPPMTFHHHHPHQFGVYGEHVMGGYYFGMSTYGAAGDGGVAGTSHSQPQHPTAAAAAAAAAFDPYAAYK